jgi:hypothetical protein
MTTSTITGQGCRDTETGEPDEATSLKSGSEGGWGKRPVMDLARNLPNYHKEWAADQKAQRAARRATRETGDA